MRNHHAHLDALALYRLLTQLSAPTDALVNTFTLTDDYRDAQGALKYAALTVDSAHAHYDQRVSYYACTCTTRDPELLALFQQQSAHELVEAIAALASSPQVRLAKLRILAE